MQQKKPRAGSLLEFGAVSGVHHYGACTLPSFHSSHTAGVLRPPDDEFNSNSSIWAVLRFAKLLREGAAAVCNTIPAYAR